MEYQVLTVLIICLHEALSGLSMPSVCPQIISKREWGGRRANSVTHQIIPVDYVIINHSVTDTCTTRSSCEEMLRSIQNFHMDNNEFDDIGYNFVIGGDGNVYEGAGWYKLGAHAFGYNSRSVGIGFLGRFSSVLPPQASIEAAKKLMECGVALGQLESNYKLLGARQVILTESPGSMLYEDMKEWPHFSYSA